MTAMARHSVSNCYAMAYYYIFTNFTCAINHDTMTRV